jgi:hypothetical protein
MCMRAVGRGIVTMTLVLLYVLYGSSFSEELQPAGPCTTHTYWFRANLIDNEVQLFINGALILKGYAGKFGNTLEGKLTRVHGPGDTDHVNLTPFLTAEENTLTIRSINYAGCCWWSLNAAVWQDGQLLHHKPFRIHTCAPKVHDEELKLPRRTCTQHDDEQGTS